MINHMSQIAGKLNKNGIDAMLITSEPGEFYATGFHGEGVVLITGDKTWYFTDNRYIEEANDLVKGANVATAPGDKDYPTVINELVKANNINKLGFEDEYMSVKQMNHWTDKVECEFVPKSDMLTDLRMVKDEEELACMREAQRITDETFTAMCQFIKVGMTEQEIGARIQYEMFTRGAACISFDPIVASGPNGSKPHAVPSQRKVQRGDFITLDFGCKFGGYCSDMTRTIALGQPSEEMIKVYNTVLEAQLAGIAAAKGGAKGCDVDAMSRKVIQDAGYGEYFGHGLGHSLGYEIHENPRFSPACKDVIPAGAALSVEPGIYLPGKFGVRIEDVVVLNESGCVNLTKSPKELIIL